MSWPDSVRLSTGGGKVLNGRYKLGHDTKRTVRARRDTGAMAAAMTSNAPTEEITNARPDRNRRPSRLSARPPRRADDRPDQRLHPGHAAGRGAGDPHRYAGPRCRRGANSHQRRQAACLFRQAGAQGNLPRGAGERGDLRRPRIYQGRLPPAGQGGVFRRGDRDTMPASAICRR